MEIKIDSNIPVPPIYRKGKWEDLVQEMKTGDSFIVNNDNEYRSVYNAAKKNGCRVCTRVINGVRRVWKIS